MVSLNVQAYIRADKHNTAAFFSHFISILLFLLFSSSLALGWLTGFFFFFELFAAEFHRVKLDCTRFCDTQTHNHLIRKCVIWHWNKVESGHTLFVGFMLAARVVFNIFMYPYCMSCEMMDLWNRADERTMHKLKKWMEGNWIWHYLGGTKFALRTFPFVRENMQYGNTCQNEWLSFFVWSKNFHKTKQNRRTRRNWRNFCY